MRIIFGLFTRATSFARFFGLKIKTGFSWNIRMFKPLTPWWCPCCLITNFTGSLEYFSLWWKHLQTSYPSNRQLPPAKGLSAAWKPSTKAPQIRHSSKTLSIVLKIAWWHRGIRRVYVWEPAACPPRPEQRCRGRKPFTIYSIDIQSTLLKKLWNTIILQELNLLPNWRSTHSASTSQHRSCKSVPFKRVGFSKILEDVTNLKF